MCGTPLYIAPEVVRNQGHDYSCDHWSWAVLTYEMMTGSTPFHRRGMDQIGLFRAIASCDYKFPKDGNMSSNAKDLIKRVLLLNQRKRLGSLAGGVDDIFAHKWFKDTDFGALRRKEVEAPWLPNIKDPLDSSKFQQWDHLEEITKRQYPKLASKAHKLFEDF
jgi:serine/threonine protein kinase